MSSYNLSLSGGVAFFFSGSKKRKKRGRACGVAREVRDKMIMKVILFWLGFKDKSRVIVLTYTGRSSM